MFDRLIQRLTGAEPDTAEDKAPADRVAIAAVLVNAAMADGVYLDAEKATIQQILAERFGLSDADAQDLLAEGEEAHAGATDLVRFTRVLKDTIPFEERVGVIEAVWRVIYADQDRDAYEANLVRRLCGLLYVPDREAGLARQRVTGES
ncbi:MAG: TerB family tellurite resistance protein [Pseudomonadota bacterium]